MASWFMRDPARSPATEVEQAEETIPTQGFIGIAMDEVPPLTFNRSYLVEEYLRHGGSAEERVDPGTGIRYITGTDLDGRIADDRLPVDGRLDPYSYEAFRRQDSIRERDAAFSQAMGNAGVYIRDPSRLHSEIDRVYYPGLDLSQSACVREGVAWPTERRPHTPPAPPHVAPTIKYEIEMAKVNTLEDLVVIVKLLVGQLSLYKKEPFDPIYEELKARDLLKETNA